MRFALQDKLTGLKECKEIFESAKHLGFDGVEITHFEGAISKDTSLSILKASQSTGIPVSAVCGGYKHWIGDFNESNRLKAIGDIKTSLRYLAEFGAEGLIAPAAYGMFSKRLPPLIQHVVRKRIGRR